MDGHFLPPQSQCCAQSTGNVGGGWLSDREPGRLDLGTQSRGWKEGRHLGLPGALRCLAAVSQGNLPTLMAEGIRPWSLYLGSNRSKTCLELIWQHLPGQGSVWYAAEHLWFLVTGIADVKFAARPRDEHVVHHF